MPIAIHGVVSSHFTESSRYAGRMTPAGIRASVQAYDAAGYDQVLVAWTSNTLDAWTVATYAAGVTERLGFLIAHRTGFVAPTVAARMAATLDQCSGGRITLHVI